MGAEGERPVIIDCLQFCNWSDRVFDEIAQAGITAIHVTVAYHGNFNALSREIAGWHRRFEAFPHRVFQGRTGADVARARREGRTAIFFGLQNPSPIEDDIGLVTLAHDLGVRFMQLTYNQQSLLGTGCQEGTDSGITAMGREVIREMNRLGMVVDMSHSGETSTLQAIELSARPIAVTHANPSSWREGPRNKSDDVLRALGRSGGMLGFSLYAHHLRNGGACTLAEFCEMVARTADLMGVDAIGIGTDLCQDQPDSVVTWMRNGTWTRSGAPATFPDQPAWIRSNLDIPGIAAGLRAVGMSDADVAKVMGLNWLRFFEASFAPAVGAG